MKKRLGYIAIVSALLVCFLVSCEKLDIKEQRGEMGYGKLKVAYDWQEAVPVFNSTSVVTIMAARLTDTYHTYFRTDTSACFISENPYVESLEQETDTIGTYKENWKVVGGDYSMIAVTTDSTVNVFDNVGFVVNKDSIGMQDLLLAYTEMKEEEIPYLGRDKWIDKNPGYVFLNNSGDKYVGKLNKVDVPTDGGISFQKFLMTKLTQTVTFSFDFEILFDDGFDLEKTLDADLVKAEITGVVPEINLSEETFYSSWQCRMFLDGKCEQISESGGVRKYNYTGSISVPGIIAGGDNSVISGPGVLRVGILLYVKNQISENPMRFIIMATQNLSEEIEQAQLSEQLNSDGLRKQTKKEAEIKVEKILRVDLSALLKGGDGITGWQESSVSSEI